MTASLSQPRQLDREELLAFARDVLGDEADAYEELLDVVSEEELLELFAARRHELRVEPAGRAPSTTTADSLSTGSAEVAAFAREVLGDQAAEYEDVLNNITLEEFCELFGDELPEQLLSSLSAQGVAADAPGAPETQRGPQPEGGVREEAPNVGHEQIIGAPSSSAVAARAGIGARAFARQTKEKDVPEAAGASIAPGGGSIASTQRPLLHFCMDDDSDFEGPSPEVRCAFEAEVSQLRDSIGRRREAFAQLCSTANVASVDNASASAADGDHGASEGVDKPKAAGHAYGGAVVHADGERESEHGLSSEQANDLAYLEDLMLKNELFHKALLYDLTKLETADLFEQRGLDAPKDGDFDIVKQLLTQSKATDAARFREQLRSKGGTKLRFVNNEMVETKSKYLMPKKDSEFIKGTTVSLTLLGNSSKARREQRKEDVETAGRRAGPVSNTKVTVKKK